MSPIIPSPPKAANTENLEIALASLDRAPDDVLGATDGYTIRFTLALCKLTNHRDGDEYDSPNANFRA